MVFVGSMPTVVTAIVQADVIASTLDRFLALEADSTSATALTDMPVWSQILPFDLDMSAVGAGVGVVVARAQLHLSLLLRGQVAVGSPRGKDLEVRCVAMRAQARELLDLAEHTTAIEIIDEPEREAEDEEDHSVLRDRGGEPNICTPSLCWTDPST